MSDSPAPRRSDPPPGRRPSITREDLIAAALALVGPNRSVSTLGLREVAREARIAPNSFYRHFRDIDELAVTLIERAGSSLRTVIARAIGSIRSQCRAQLGRAFFEQFRADDKLLHCCARVSRLDAFKQAVDANCATSRKNCASTSSALPGVPACRCDPALVCGRSRAWCCGRCSAMDLPRERDAETIEQLTTMVKMIVIGARACTRPPPAEATRRGRGRRRPHRHDTPTAGGRVSYAAHARRRSARATKYQSAATGIDVVGLTTDGAHLHRRVVMAVVVADQVDRPVALAQMWPPARCGATPVGQARPGVGALVVIGEAAAQVPWLQADPAVRPHVEVELL